MIHFYECITQDEDPHTPGHEARKDVELAAAMIRAYVERVGR